MKFESVDNLIESVIQQPGWENFLQYRLLLQGWQEIVKPEVAQNARPIYVARNILWVATSSSVWAQNLSFQRYRLLKQLKAYLQQNSVDGVVPIQLKDMKFSPAHWHKQPLTDSSIDKRAIALAQHPSYIGDQLEKNATKEHRELQPQSPRQGKDNPAQESLQRWLVEVNQRSHDLPLCPLCQTPTPEKELERWQMCAFCFAKKETTYTSVDF